MDMISYAIWMRAAVLGDRSKGVTDWLNKFAVRDSV